MRIPWLFDLPCSDYDIPAIELWLSDQARRGKLLTAWRVFEPCPPRACLYALEPAGKEEYKPSEEKQEAYAQAGWEYVCFTSGDVFIVWRSTRPDPAPLRTDPAADSYAYSYLWKKYCRNTVGAVLLCAAFLALFLWMAARGGLAAYNLVTNAGIAWTQVFVIVFLLLLIGITAADTRMLRRLLKALATGVPMPERRPTRRRLAVNRLLRWVLDCVFPAHLVLVSRERAASGGGAAFLCHRRNAGRRPRRNLEQPLRHPAGRHGVAGP